MIADVTLTRQAQSVQVIIRWHTNQVDTSNIQLPALGSPKTPKPILERIRSLYTTHTDPEIAVILNQEGFRTAYGNLFTTKIVADTRRRNNLRK